RKRLRERLNLLEDEKIILFLSRIHPKKGLEHLISALSSLKELPFTFVLAGSGDTEYEREVRSLLQKSGLKTRTMMPGFVEGETKNLLLQGSDIYALTSHSENFGVAVLEALAAGLPTIVTPGVALAEEIKNHQLGYVSELNQQAITQTFRRCLHNLETAKQIGKRAQQFVLEQYTWKNNADTLIRIYRDILGIVASQPSRKSNAANSYIQRSS
ncbi:MAG: glycosyltransferase, partial [Cyanobacteria bacterium J06553_1]